MPRIRRCKPLLGTFVEIEAWDSDSSLVNAAIDSAFERIKNIQSLMSFHEPKSELTLVNSCQTSDSIVISSDTFNVFSFSKHLHIISKGVFDICVGKKLVSVGNLPELCLEGRDGTSKDISLHAGNKLRFEKPVVADLGGVAKGYAVDEAVKVLKKMGIEKGIVNAGGDLRLFGNEKQKVFVRDILDSRKQILIGEFDNIAVATSSSQYKHSVVDTNTNRVITETKSISVIAKTCMVADAMTKVLWSKSGASKNHFYNLSQVAFQ